MQEAPTDWLDHSARTHPETVALIGGGEALTYERLRDEAGSVAATLADTGVGAGDPVAIDSRPGFRTRSPCTARSLPARSSSRCRQAGAEGVDVARGMRRYSTSGVGRAAHGRAGRPGRRFSRHPALPLTRVLSSGTSGAPKPVLLTAGNHLWSALGSALKLGVERDDRWLCCLPLNHVGGLSILIRSVVYGTGALIEPGFDVDRVAGLLDDGEASVASLVPTQLVRLLDAGAALAAPRLLLIGGGPVPAEVLEEALGRGATVVQTYGLTEACSQVCTLGARRGAVGTSARRAGRCPAPRSGSKPTRSSFAGRRWPRRRSPPTAGCTAAISAVSTPTATCGSRAGATT